MSSNSLVVDVPTLEEYLSKLICTGCSRRCPLTALKCGRGTTYKNAAISEYEALYTNSSPAESEAPKEYSSSKAEQEPSVSSRDTVAAPEQEIEPDNPVPEAVPPVQSKTTFIDFAGLMGTVIITTHYGGGSYAKKGRRKESGSRIS